MKINPAFETFSVAIHFSKPKKLKLPFIDYDCFNVGFRYFSLYFAPWIWVSGSSYISYTLLVQGNDDDRNNDNDSINNFRDERRKRELDKQIKMAERIAKKRSPDR